MDSRDAASESHYPWRETEAGAAIELILAGPGQRWEHETRPLLQPRERAA
jgi:hypothetical protein